MDLASSHFYLTMLAIFIHFKSERVEGQGLSCPARAGRWPDPVQCDAYLECKDGRGERKLCPDGLVYAIERRLDYPCVYPPETDCRSRPNRQPSQPTVDCPHQFGMYGFGDSTLCSRYMSCSNGQMYIKECPEGLAFDEENIRCNWPDQVPSCNVEAYLGFSCPSANPAYYGESASYDFYRAPGSCDRYFICIDSKPRLLICSPGLLFDSDTNMCLSAENVTSCYRAASRTSQQGYQSSDSGFQSNQQGFQSNQQGYQSNQQGYQSNQQGYQSSQRGFQSGQQGGYQSNKQDYPTNQGFQSNQQDYSSNQGYQNNQFNPDSFSSNDYFGR